jgi:hypothetical protein
LLPVVSGVLADKSLIFNGFPICRYVGICRLGGYCSIL